MADIARIEERIDRVAAGAVEVSDALGGMRFQNMTEVMEFAKLMSVAGNAVPKHLQGNPGMCLAVCVQALEWRFSPFAVANKSYEVQNRLAFESQLVHAVIEQRAPIIGRLRHKFDGEGDERRCIVSATLRETSEPLEYISPPFGKITPKNSPLWKTKPDLQLYYNTSRDFCRVYFPDVLLGVYSDDELRDHVGPDHAKDISDKPGVSSRLRGRRGRGFDHDHVETTTRGVIDETAKHENAPADAGAGAATGSASAAPINSSQGDNAPQPHTETKPAPEGTDATSVGAGATSQSSDATQNPASDEERQAGEPGNLALDGSAGLPEGLRPDWKTAYAQALGRVQKIGALSRVSAEFWKPFNYEKIKGTEIHEQERKIYAAFVEHFGAAHVEKRNAALKELGAI